MQTSFDNFRKLITTDTTICYVYGLPATFMFDDADDMLNIYFTQNDEEFTIMVVISENSIVNFHENEASLCDDEGDKITVTMFQEIPMDISDSVDKLNGKY